MAPHGEATRTTGRERRPTPGMVWGRAVVLGAVAFLTGVVSHASAGGLLPGPVGLTLLLASCVAAAAVLVRVRVRPGRLVLLVLLGQTWVHTVLSATAGHRSGPGGATSDVGVAAGSLDPAVPLVVDGRGTLLEQFRESSDSLAGPGQDWLSHQVEHFTTQSPLMVLAHLGGAAALGLFLAVGEDALFSLLALAAARGAERGRVLQRAALVKSLVACAAARSRLLVPLVPQLWAPQVLAAPVLRHRGPPFVLAA